MVPFRQFPLVSALEPCLWCEECDLDTRRKTLKKKKKKTLKKKIIIFVKVEDKASRAVVELAALTVSACVTRRETRTYSSGDALPPELGETDGLRNQNAWGGGRTRVPSGSNSSQPPEPESQPSDPV